MICKFEITHSCRCSSLCMFSCKFSNQYEHLMNAYLLIDFPNSHSFWLPFQPHFGICWTCSEGIIYENPHAATMSLDREPRTGKPCYLRAFRLGKSWPWLTRRQTSNMLAPNHGVSVWYSHCTHCGVWNVWPLKNMFFRLIFLSGVVSCSQGLFASI